MGDDAVMKLWVQKREECEAGWGTRPDGYTLHLEREDISTFLAVMRAREQDGKPPGYVPREYSRPDGQPYQIEAEDSLVKKVKKSKYWMWDTGQAPSPPPGVNPGGWAPVRS